MHDGMNANELLGSIDHIEDAPIAHGVFVQWCQVARKAFMAEILDVGGDPLGLFKQTLRHWRADARKVFGDTCVKHEAIPGHLGLPTQSQSLCNLFARQPLTFL